MLRQKSPIIQGIDKDISQIINKTINSKPGFFKEYENEHLIGLALRNGFIETFPCR